MAHDAATGTSHDCGVVSTAASTAGTSAATGAATSRLEQLQGRRRQEEDQAVESFRFSEGARRLVRRVIWTCTVLSVCLNSTVTHDATYSLTHNGGNTTQ